MSRKDTILIAVIINAGLLAILFATAIIYDTDKLIDHPEFDTSLAEAGQETSDQMKLIPSHQSQVNEMDHTNNHYVESPISSPLEQEELYFQDPDLSKVGNTDYIEIKTDSRNMPKADYIEVTVKKGDSLEKIARANGTSISAIKKANQLNSERLSIGQMLKIPIKKDQSINDQSSSPASIGSPAAKPGNLNSEAVYHTVKSGDSPWKIAREYGVNYEEILILNHLDEDKARNLKIGDRIRVK